MKLSVYAIRHEWGETITATSWQHKHFSRLKCVSGFTDSILSIFQSWCRQRNSREEKHIGGIRAFILNYGAIFGPIFWLLAGTLQMDRGLTLLVFHILRVGARRLRLVITHIRSLNSKGIPCRSPGLRAMSYLGRAVGVANPGLEDAISFGIVSTPQLNRSG